MWTVKTLRGMAGMNGQSKCVSSAAAQHSMTKSVFSFQVSSGLCPVESCVVPPGELSC